MSKRAELYARGYRGAMLEFELTREPTAIAGGLSLKQQLSLAPVAEQIPAKRSGRVLAPGELELLEQMLFSGKHTTAQRAVRGAQPTRRKETQVKFTVAEMLAAQERLSSQELMDRQIAQSSGAPAEAQAARLERTVFSIPLMTPDQAKLRLAQLQAQGRAL